MVFDSHTVEGDSMKGPNGHTLIEIGELTCRAKDVRDAAEECLDRGNENTVGKSGIIVAHTDTANDRDGYIVRQPHGGKVETTPLCNLAEARYFALAAIAYQNE